jgi:hypothetical protein
VAKLGQVKASDLRYDALFAVVVIALSIAWSRVTKATTDQVLLPMLCPAALATGPLRVTNDDGTLSNGAKLRGWRRTAYFSVQGGLCMVGCMAIIVALLHIWPNKGTLNGDRARDFVKKPAPPDDLA